MEDPSSYRKCVLLSLTTAGRAHFCSQSSLHLRRPQAQSSVPTQMLPRAQAQTWLQTSSVLQRPCGQACLFPGDSSGYFLRNPSPRDTLSASHFTEEGIEAQRGKQSGEHRAINGARGNPGQVGFLLSQSSTPQNCLSSGVPVSPTLPRSPESHGSSLESARDRTVMWN